MQTSILIENEFVTLRYSPDKRILYHTVQQPVDEEVFKSSLNKGVEMIEENHIQKWLSDDRQNGPFSAAFSEWAINDWIPRAIKAGWKYWANVVPDKLNAANTLTPFIEHLHEKGLRMALFTNIEEAMAWLENME